MYKGRISECLTNLISGVETTVNKYYKLNNKKKCCDKFKVKKPFVSFFVSLHVA